MRLTHLFLATALACPALPCAAQLNNPDAAIHHRKAFTLINTYFTRIYQATHGERSPWVAW